jgi:uncharacterized membrane protein
MPTSPSALPNSLYPTKAETLAHRRKELAYARALGLGTGVFLLLWAPECILRWSGLTPVGEPSQMWRYALWFSRFEAVYFTLYGLLLLVPYGRVRNRRLWRGLFGVLAVAALVYVFVWVFDVMFVYMVAAEFNQQPFPPVLGSALVFLGLLQVPVVLFSRHPDWMD